VFALTCLAVGCGSSEELGQLVPVSGKVKVEKIVVTAGMVTYFPDEAKGNKSNKVAEGPIQPDGSYTLSTAGKAGCPVGWYKVTIINTGVSDASKKAAVEIAGVYSAPTSTPLSVEVRENAPDKAYDFQLSR
jgi:hypothetical protein